jgi:hypothetical protein
VVGTPGTVKNWIMRMKYLDPRKVNVFVLDEADKMVEEKALGAETMQIRNLLHKDVQILFFSATYTPEVLNYARKVRFYASYSVLLHSVDLHPVPHTGEILMSVFRFSVLAKAVHVYVGLILPFFAGCCCANACTWGVALPLTDFVLVCLCAAGGAPRVHRDAPQHRGAGVGRDLPGAHGRAQVPGRQATGA